jgi:antitoxin component HigA of HigAB toxin-antitoxin module
MKRADVRDALIKTGYTPQMANHILAKRRNITFEHMVKLEEQTGLTARQLNNFINSLPKDARSSYEN